ncbi:MAG: polynucleotide adenylyltransferase PcnB [Vicinamibacterales bacterium]
MVAPFIVPRAEHSISRKNIDPDALKVLYRLRDNHFTAYLVGGGVRDLLLGRQPKDFDIGTDAHPYQIKKLFRNCWIIGRRFRLAHVKFGQKTIEVATFRKNVPDTPSDPPVEETTVVASVPEAPESASASPIHRDNTFGTPEEDAFRRDFTVNGLFYDISTFSVIDYVGGLKDLEDRMLRSIGDPKVRFVEDPVRMTRAAVFAARLDFRMDDEVRAAIAQHRKLITLASPARLLEEYFKILRSGYAEASFRALLETRLLELVTPELKSPSEEFWESLARLDDYRRRFPSAPPQLTTPILVGALVSPLGLLSRKAADAGLGGDGRPPERFSFGMLPIARRDLERLRHINQLLPRLADPNLPPRVARSIVNRPAFDDALTWLEVFSDSPELVTYWRVAQRERGEQAPGPAGRSAEGDRPAGRRRRRRRRRR